MSALELLSGDAQTFVAKVWASRVHLHQGDADRLSRLLRFDDVDRLLTSTAIRTPAVRLARDGQVLPASSYTRSATLAGQPLTGLVDPRKVFDLFDEGATVVLQGLHRYWEPLAALVTELELELGHPCQANAYLTPPGSQGFALHRDSHDVFVFQTHGSKVWEVHQAASTDVEQPGDPSEVVLEPGVCMYLPTGTAHAARTQQTASLHVTVGINQLTWKDLLGRILGEALDEIGAGPLPAGYLDDPGPLGEELEGKLGELAEAVRAVDTPAAAEAQRRRFLTGRTLWHRAGLADRLAVRELSDNTDLRRRPGRPCVTFVEGDRLHVLLGDRKLDMPVWLDAAMASIRERASLRPADLAGLLDEQSRLVLCRRLVREGLLEVVA